MEKGRNETSGWLAYLLKKHKLLEEGNALWARVMSDYQCQLVAIETMEATAGADVDPRLVSEHRQHRACTINRMGSFTAVTNQAFQREFSQFFICYMPTVGILVCSTLCLSGIIKYWRQDTLYVSLTSKDKTSVHDVMLKCMGHVVH
jgi:hypothetical protein